MENPYFSRIMDAVNLIVQDNLRKKNLQRKQQYDLNIMNKQFNLQQEAANRELKRSKELLEKEQTGKFALEALKQTNEENKLVALPKWVEDKYPILAGYGKRWKPSEVASIVQKAKAQESLEKYRNARLHNERLRLNKSSNKAGSNKTSGNDILEFLNNLREEALKLFSSGYIDEYGEKAGINKDDVGNYLKKIDELIGKIRSGKATKEDFEFANRMKSFLAQSSAGPNYYYGFWDYAKDMLDKVEQGKKNNKKESSENVEKTVQSLIETLKQLDKTL